MPLLRCYCTAKLRAMMMLAVFITAFSKLDAQLSVTASANAQNLAQTLAGSGVTITNYSRTGDPNSSGTFTNNGTNIGLSAGVILTTGKVQNIAQSANNFASNSFSGSGDAQLQTLTTGYIYDKSVLEFDITPQGNVLQFNYVFASEEYPEWVCTQFNDVFGFFITGPNPGGGNYASTSIATIGNTGLPVSINTINQGTPGAYGSSANCQSLGYSSLFRNNLSPTVNNDIVFDGMTVPLTAMISVVPCQTYHLKLAVADVSDRIYDSGVMLEANSISSTSIAITSESQLDSLGYNSAYEGCVSAKFKFSLPAPQPADVVANIQVTGTATNGVDYPTIPATITIPAGQSSTTLTILPYEDHIAESPESITISTVAPCSGLTLSTSTIMIQDDVPASVTPAQSTSCPGQPVQLLATGGTAYTWTPVLGLDNANASNPIATPSSNTTYTANISWGSCNKTGTAAITVGGAAVSIAASPSLSNCNGGPVQLTANGGSQAIYQWPNNVSGATFNATTSGTYTVTVSDPSGCSSTASANVVISSVSLNAPFITAACSGVNNGSIDIAVNGNDSPYTYLWSNSATSEDISNLAAGSYTVTVTNNIGCSVTHTYSVTQAASSVSANAVVTQVSCNGGTNGQIQLNVSGGNTPYTYHWNDNSTGSTLGGLSAGNYAYTVNDASGCGTSNTVNVTEPSAINISSTHSNVSCNNGSNGTINITVTGGVAPYGYVWNDNNTNQNRTSIGSGTYTVVVTDANGCTSSNTTSVTQATSLTASLSTVNSSCTSATGGATVNANNGSLPYNYSWSNDVNAHNASVSNVAPGNIIVTVTDANGCSVMAQGNIGVTGNNLSADFSYSGNFCGPVTTIEYTPADSVNPTNSYWDFGNGDHSLALADPPATYTAPGTYQVVHIVTNGYCSDTVTKTITIFPQPQIAATVNNPSCGNSGTGSILLNVTAGLSPYTFVWNDNSPLQNRNNLNAGNFAVTVTDQHSCTSSFNTSITQSSGLNVNETHTNVTCNGAGNGGIHLSVNGGVTPYNFIWSNGLTTPDLNSLAPGSYTVTANDVNGCNAVVTVNITEPAAITANETHNNATCYQSNNGNIQVSVNGGNSPYAYLWNDGITTPNRANIAAGFYHVVVTDANSCTTTKDINIVQPAPIVVNLSTVNPACGSTTNGRINVSVSGSNGAVEYLWNNGASAQSLTGLAAGNYAVTVTDEAGCTMGASTTLVQSSPIQLAETHNNPNCISPNSGSIHVTATGGTPSYDFRWNNGNTSAVASGLAAGNYSLTVSDAAGCQAFLNNVTLTQPSPIQVTAQATDVACAGNNNGKVELAMIGGTAPITYIWSNGSSSQNISNVAPGNYSVTVTDGRGCTQTSSAQVHAGASLSVGANVPTLACSGQQGTIDVTVANGTAPYSFQWNNGATSEDIRDATAGTYTVTIRDVHNCSFDTSFVVTANNSFSVTATSNSPVTIGQPAELHAVSTGSDMVTYSWTPGVSCVTCKDVTVTPVQETIYTVVATDTNGCVATDTVRIDVSDETNLFLPNAFTPNGDGNNDILQLYGNLASIKYFQLLIFDRWGEKVFETNDASFNWDGTYKGEKLQSSVYLYVMKTVMVDGKTNRAFKGTITMLK